MSPSTPQPPTPIQLTIPPSLAPLRIPLSTYLATHTSTSTNRPYTNLALGALIFDPPTFSPTKLLLLRRAPSEHAFPNLWEVPGGSSDDTDPTVLHSLVREVFEETGLRVGRFVRGVGRGVEFVTGREGERRWMKLSFEVEVLEMGGGNGHGHGADCGHEGRETADGDGEGDGGGKVDVQITLDPEEHSEYVWATEEDVRGDRYAIVTPEQKEVMLEGFKLRRGDGESVKAAVEGAQKGS